FGFGSPYSGIQSSEQRIFNQHTGFGQPVEDLRLSCVVIAGDRYGRYLVSTPPCPLSQACIFHMFNVPPQLRHTITNTAPVQLNLCFTRTAGTNSGTTGCLTASLTGHGFTPTTQPW